MHIDTLDLPKDAKIEGDLCIVGAGAAGIAIAREWAGSNKRVILLEGGGMTFTDEVQDRYAGKATGQAYYPLRSTRLHYFGGTTGHWSGWCSPFDPIDFEERSWVPNSGWPITREQLDPYYARAHPILELGPYDYSVGCFTTNAPRKHPLPFDESVVWSKMWQFSPPTRFGSKYRDEIVSSSNVQLYTHAQAVRIDCDPNLRAADAIVIRDPAGRTFAVRAKRYILACNGIQTPRLLLASNHQSPAGVGNSRDLVGRYFCEHVEMSAAELWLKKSQKLPLYVFSQKPRAELALSARAQELHGSLNGSISLHPLNYARKFKSALEVWSDEDPRTNEKRMQAAFEHVHETRWFTRLTTDVYRSYQMFIRVEQAPNANSRITLDDEKDAMGMPRARLHWELGALEKHSIRTICTVIGDEVRRLGIGSVKLLPYLNSAMDSSWPSFTGAGWHHNGTTRMHSDPTRGVVDANCRLHDLENLYVAGESCFPTAGIANPTLTVVALALRLSDHLKTLA